MDKSDNMKNKMIAFGVLCLLLIGSHGISFGMDNPTNSKFLTNKITRRHSEPRTISLTDHPVKTEHNVKKHQKGAGVFVTPNNSDLGLENSGAIATEDPSSEEEKTLKQIQSPIIEAIVLAQLHESEYKNRQTAIVDLVKQTITFRGNPQRTQYIVPIQMTETPFNITTLEEKPQKNGLYSVYLNSGSMAYVMIEIVDEMAKKPIITPTSPATQELLIVDQEEPSSEPTINAWPYSKRKVIFFIYVGAMSLAAIATLLYKENKLPDGITQWIEKAMSSLSSFTHYPRK